MDRNEPENLPNTVVIIEDDESIAKLMSIWLEPYDFHCQHFFEAETFLKQLDEKGLPRLLVLDWRLPGISGLELLRVLKNRQTLRNIPVLLCSAVNQMDDIAAALYLGADAYLTKPLHKTLFIAHMYSVLRHYESNPVKRRLPSRLALNANDQRISLGSASIRLTSKEFSLIQLLMKHRGEIIERDVLLNMLWPATIRKSANRKHQLDILISRLRTKLHKFDDLNERIITHYGFGYSLQCD